jgi:RNA polymerase sigma factor (sigma-70 family)
MNAIIGVLRKKFGIIDFGTIDFDTLYDMVSECSDDKSRSFEMASLIYNVVSLPINFEEIADRENMDTDVSDIKPLYSRLYVSDEQCIEEIFQKELHSNVNRMLDAANVSERERKILYCIFGFYMSRQFTLEETGKLMGCTRERIRQIVAKLLKRLRSANSDMLKKYFNSM